jgi:hypothetical protein
MIVCAWPLWPAVIVNGHSIAKDHFAALPPGEQYDERGDNRQAQPERHDRARSSLAVERQRPG